MARVLQGLSGLILAGLLVHSYLLAVMLLQFYLAGADEVGAESWKWHEIWGYFLGVPILLLMVLTLLGRLGWRAIGVTALLAAMFATQIALNRVRVDAPYLPMLYAANGLAMMGLTTTIDRTRSPDDDVQRPDAGPGLNEDHLRQHGGRVNTGASAYLHHSKRITTYEAMGEISKGVPASRRRCTAKGSEMTSAPSSPHGLAADLLGGPMRARLSPRGGREKNGVRIDKGVNDDHVRI